MKKRIISGIRATNKLHLGNYLGSLKQFVDLQNTGDYDCYFFVADLHALTTDFDPKSLSENTLEIVATYLAAGLDPKKSTLFLQNQIHEHSELAWIFNCITPLSELERMTQFKDKSKENSKNINAGLLTYPALMAADILLYKPEFVPVGDDQTQHLELSRIIARKFNNRFGKTFPEPKNFALKPVRVMSLKDPNKKMSKTGDEPVYMDDSPEVIAKKISKAVTATSGKSVGVDNLMFLLRSFGKEEQVKYFEKEIKAGTIKFSDLKGTLANEISSYFADFRTKKAKLLKDKNYLAGVLADGAKKAKSQARETLLEVKAKIGLL